jgi:hypothetical protein
MSRSSPSFRTKRLSAAAFRDVLRRLDVIERRLAGRSTDSTHGSSDLMRRWDIVEEERLRRRVADDTALRRDNPVRWRELERIRRTQNRETSALNRRLRAEGLGPMELAPTLEQRVKKLQQLEVRNRAGSATLKSRSSPRS